MTALQTSLSQLISSRSGLSEVLAASIIHTFEPMVQEAGTIAASVETLEVTDINQTDEMAAARKARLQLRTCRVSAEKAKKELKADALARGKAIDACFNYIVDELIGPVEEKMRGFEEFADRKAAETLDALEKARKDELRPYVISVEAYQLRDMPEVAYREMLAGAMAAKKTRDEQAEKDRIAREQAEEQRKADAAKLAEENRKLREDNARKDAEAKAEREAADKKLREERDAREKLEREAAQKQADEEAKAKAEKAAATKAARAPDKAKVLAFIADIRAIQPPTTKAPESQRFVQNIVKEINAVLDRAAKAAEGM